MKLRAFAAPLLLAAVAASLTRAAPSDYFAIHVVDDQTGRGVPLVYLQSVYKQRYITDSDGYVAFNEPGLMDAKDVWMDVRSYGYEELPGAFGIHGIAVKPTPGGSVEIRLKRTQIAERLYRMTGFGLYRDTVLLGKAPPIQQPLLNAQVTGSDTVQCAVYHGKLFWNWQDTDRVGFPLGNFSMTGATSDLPPALDPDKGLDFTYFTPKPGEFAKAMAHVPVEGSHPIWADGLTVVKDDKGQERLIAKYIAANKDFSPAEAGLLVYDDATQTFERLAKFDGPHNGRDTLSPGGHAYFVRDGDTRYACYGTSVRVKADFASASDPKQYEAFTCLTPNGQANRRDGKLVWSWVKGGRPVTSGSVDELIKKNVIRPEESPFTFKEADTGKTVNAASTGIAWNAYLNCWVDIFGQRDGAKSNLGETWVSFAHSPQGPWSACREISTHAMKDNANDFYNVVQHYELAKQSGRYVYYSGTFVTTFSGNPWPTPYYNYNNIVYRLDLSDPRLKLPIPAPLTQTRPDVPVD